MKTEARYLIYAAAVSVTVTVVAPVYAGDAYLDLRLWIYAAGFGAAWTVYRSTVFAFAWRRWRAWRRPAGWSVQPQELAIESSRGRLPPWLARRLHSRLPAKWKERLYADKGILVGRGFRWGPEHTQALENHLQGGQALPVGRDARGGHPALHAVGWGRERPLVLPWSELVGHVLIGGTTRSGKTRLLELIVSEAIRGPGTVIVIDPKGDADLLVRTAAECYRMGREFAFFSPAHADQSASFNPFSMCKTTTELAARVQALMPGGGGMAKGDPFFTEYPLAVVERLGAAQ
ncbi:MAG: type IV secretory system conjugative DNA transfer family protein, partial [Candidatus Tectomicrobia bacterium]|nr:type IV secretory system conjugative DNA transfer family protein [Candidatus Tectomicrobia bacterium]